MYLVIKELMGLPDMPVTVKGVRDALAKQAGNSSELVRKRKGTKAFEYHIDCLPAKAREVIQQRHYASVMEQSGCKSVDVPVCNRKTTAKPSQELEIMRQCPALLEREVGSLTDKQKQIADARALLAQEVEKLIAAGASRARAVQLISEGSRDGTLPDRIVNAAEVANARKGKTRTGISVRCLQEWVTLYRNTGSGAERLALMSPGHTKAKQPEDIGWFYTRFAPHYRNQNGPNLSEAYRSFRDEWREIYRDQPAMLSVLPSYHAVRRLLNKLPLREQIRGRITGSAAKAYEVYQRRDWSLLPVNGCWISDGKSLELKVEHPVTGRSFTPELTMVIDGRTRYVVGWSLSLSESCLAVADAYRYAMERHGKPLFVYSDNGGGETNNRLDAEITGIFPRLGIEHMLSRPGNPQARGIIERLNAVIPSRLAKRFQTFYGSSADPESVRKTGKNLISLSNALRSGKELTPKQKKTQELVPSWRQLSDAIEEEIEKYNNSHEHSELPKVNGKWMSPAAYRALVLEQEGDEIEYMTRGELREMFMPEVERTAQRGWLRLGNNYYFSKDLIDVDRQVVRVAFDTHDAREVIVRKMDGTYVCSAVWNGNTQSPVPVADVERQLQKRAKGQIKRGDRIIKDAQDSVRPVIEYQNDADFSQFLAPEPERQKAYIYPEDYEYDQQQNGTHR